ncbi:MAG: hypothetical protein ABIH90_02715 [Candidatus Aenigmatarchaeota archaeon]
MFAFGWLWSLAGILFLLLGGYMLLFFPFTAQHQGEEFQVSGPVIGFVLVLIGGFLVFW